MNRTDILTLYEYNYWANDRILRAAAEVSAAQLTAPFRLSHGSLRGTLVHALSAERAWRLRCQERISTAAPLAESDFPTLASLRSYWADEERAMRGYVASLTEEALVERIQYRNFKGVPLESVLWHVLAHVVNHGTQCRSEAGIALTEYGHSPGDIDMSLFFRETAS